MNETSTSPWCDNRVKLEWPPTSPQASLYFRIASMWSMGKRIDGTSCIVDRRLTSTLDPAAFAIKVKRKRCSLCIGNISTQLRKTNGLE